VTFIIDNVVEGSSANKLRESLSLSKRDKHFTVLKCWWSPPTFLDRCVVMMHVVVVEIEAISFLLSSDTAAVLKAFLFEHETRKDIAPLSSMVFVI